MLKNYFLLTVRHLLRHKLHTAINVIGLAIGISACLAIFTLVNYQQGFDQFHTDRERIYRVYTKYSGLFDATNRGMTYPMPAVARRECTGIEVGSSIHTQSLAVRVRSGEQEREFKEDNRVVIVEPQYFQLFQDYRWLAGAPQNALSEPHQVVLTESRAKLYFGNIAPQEALGREVIYQDSLRTTVTGVVADWQEPSDFNFTDFISNATIAQSWLKNDFAIEEWGSTTSSSQFFIKLEKGVSTARMLQQLQALSKKYNKGEDPKMKIEYLLQPLSELHFNPELGLFDFSGPAAHLPTLRALLIVAGLLLLIAVINFVNLATAQAVQRSKEVGVRKVLGGTRRVLILQFLGETFVVTLIAVVFSVFLADLAIRFFHEFLPKELTFRLFQPAIVLFVLGITLGVSLLAGLYPALVLSKFQPVLALKNSFFAKGTGTGSEWLRKGLIVFQFTFSLALIAGTLIIGRQIAFMQSKDLGFRTDAIVHFNAPYQQPEAKRLVLENELTKVAGIQMISRNSMPPASSGINTTIFKFNDGKETKDYEIQRKYVDTAYLHLYDLPLVAGRNLLPNDSLREFVINEKAARMLGFETPEAALNHEVEMDKKRYPIVGVVKDFHTRSLHEPIQALALSTDPWRNGFSMKLATQGQSADAFQATMARVEQAWKKVYPNEKFEYELVEESIAKFYENEQRMSKLMRTATGIAIFISCIGLFGLVSFTVVRRTKEIGIRKILGASVTNIVALLSKDLLVLVLIAIALGSPVAWYFSQQWLQDFAYRIDIQWWMFALAGVVALAIAWLTISLQAVRAATVNPVESLKAE